MSEPNNNRFSLLMIVYYSLPNDTKQVIGSFQDFVRLIWTLNSDKQDFIEYKYKELKGHSDKFMSLLNKLKISKGVISAPQNDISYYQLFEISDSNPDAFNTILRLTKVLRLTDKLNKNDLRTIFWDSNQNTYGIDMKTDIEENAKCYWPIDAKILQIQQDNQQDNPFQQDPNNKEHYFIKDSILNTITLANHESKTKDEIIATIFDPMGFKIEPQQPPKV